MRVACMYILLVSSLNLRMKFFPSNSIASLLILMEVAVPPPSVPVFFIVITAVAVVVLSSLIMANEWSGGSCMFLLYFDVSPLRDTILPAASFSVCVAFRSSPLLDVPVMVAAICQIGAVAHTSSPSAPSYNIVFVHGSAKQKEPNQ